MATNADMVAGYTEQIARLELARAEVDRALDNAIEGGKSQKEAIILHAWQTVELARKIGTLSAMRYVYAKEAPDADALLTVPF